MYVHLMLYKKNPSFSFEIPCPARVLLPIFQHSKITSELYMTLCKQSFGKRFDWPTEYRYDNP